MAINVGAVITGFTTPAIVQQSCFGHEKDCYAYAYGQYVVSNLIFNLRTLDVQLLCSLLGIIPPAGVFLPWIVLKCVFSCIFKYFADGRKKELFEYGIDDYTPQMLAEVREVATMFVVLLPAPIFWMAYDQYGSTFQNQYDQLAYIKFGSVEIDSSTSSNWNTIFIIVLIPIFNIWVYPFIEKRFGNFKLLDRMLVGMFLTSVAFISIGILQKFIDDSGSLVLDPESNALICDQANPGKCLSGWWQVIPYFIIGVAEILFSISGLNFTYSEVGSSMKAVSSSLWLLMVSIGNFLTVLIAVWYKTLGPQNFFYVNAALLFGAMLIYFFIRTQYVYKIDRKSVEQSIAVGEEKLKH
ncbi:hypothetical protein HK099_007776 [Clydaea vesicula]|uniref:Uncharacterized protein n=1 Tax=Clydaea vesicula TaxID=447962 RepID=A0AAD5Y236_9FUNG|nr:hypothetical protein HK099_007776 [Clydaea vesicula]